MAFSLKSKSKKMAIKALLFLSFMAILFSNAFSSGYEFDGVGVSQALRGGAVSADEGDWSHIYWNPAGLSGASRQVGIELRPGKMNVTDGNSIKVGGSDNIFSKKHENSSFIPGSGGAVIPLEQIIDFSF